MTIDGVALVSLRLGSAANGTGPHEPQVRRGDDGTADP